MAVIGREAARAPLTSADINDGIVTAADLASTLDLSSKTLTLGAVSSTGNLSFGDNDKAIFGAGSDLQIYHDGSNSRIIEGGTGNLLLDADNLYLRATSGNSYFQGLSGGAANIFYSGSVKLATTSAGIDVTGTVTADGLTVDGSGLIQSSTGGVLTLKSTDTEASTSSVLGQINFYNSDSSGSSPNNAVIIKSTGQSGGGNGDLEFKVTNSGIEGSDALTSLRIDDAGDISFYEDTGTTPKLFWDASAESLGIGTTGPTVPLHIVKAASGINQATDVLRLSSVDTDTSYYVGFQTQRDNSAGMGLNILTTNVLGTVSEAMRITPSGNVGIGTSSPREKIHLFGGTSSTQLLMTGGGLNSEIYGGFIEGDGVSGQGGHLRLGVLDAGTERVGIEIEAQGNQIIFDTAGTERMRIDSSGNLLVGTTSSSGAGTAGVGIANRLAVGYQGTLNGFGGEDYSGFFYSGGSSTGFTAINSSSGNAALYVTLSSSATTTSLISFGDTGAAVGRITTNGTTTSYITSSDARLKENIADAESASELIDAIQVRSFDWKADGSHQRYGMVAQELLEVAPEAVSQGETEEDMMGVDYSKLVPMLVKEIQSLRARVAQLEGA